MSFHVSMVTEKKMCYINKLFSDTFNEKRDYVFN